MELRWLEQGNHNPRVGGSSPSSATINFNEIDQIHQSHLIIGAIRVRFNTLICQSVCDPETLKRATCIQEVAPLIGKGTLSR